MKRSNGWLVLAGAMWIAFATPAMSAADATWDDKAVEASIARAKDYLWSQWRDGHWQEIGQENGRDVSTDIQYGGTSSLCAYAMLASGESPQDDRMRKTLTWLLKIDIRSTYGRALRANVWSLLSRASPYRRNLEADVRWLIAAEVNGAYTYTPPNRSSNGVTYDNSNSQMAVLGVWAGARHGMEIPEAYWRKVQKHWKDDQQPDGGWTYYHNGQSYGSMTVAGLASLFICYDNLESFLECKFQSDPPEIARGMAWLDEHFRPDQNPGRSSFYFYYLYGVERVGLASGYKYFGRQDWYKLGTGALLRQQNSDGCFGDGPVDTSFALLFLARGRHPVLFNKLQYPGSWNCRPRDLANFTRWITTTFEKEVSWQIIHTGVPVEEWHDAPILYISGATAPEFSDQDIQSLRRFVEEGGVILSEAADNRPEFTLGMKAVYARLFPGYELTRLPKDHPLFSEQLQFDIADPRGLSAVSNGVRLLAIHASNEFSRDWQMNKTLTSTDSFKLGANIYLYVTDKGILPARGVNTWPSRQDLTPTGTLKVARVKHTANWNPEPLAWERFSVLMGNEHHLAVETSGPVDISELNWSKSPVAVMTGTAAFEWSAQQRQALARYLEGGGTLIIEAAGGSEAFADSAEKELAGLLKDHALEYIPANHALYNLPGAVIDKVAYRNSLRKLVSNPSQPRLRGIRIKDRYAVIFSRDDITAGLVGYACWQVKGYQPDIAFKLMRNMLLYASGKTLISPDSPTLAPEIQ